MNVLIIMFLFLEVFFDTFALMIGQGSLMPKIKLRNILSYVFIFSMWQLVAVFVGNNLVRYIFEKLVTNSFKNENLLSGLIIIFLGILIIIKSIDSRKFLERRMDVIDFSNVSSLGLITSFDMFFISISLRLLNIDFNLILFLSLITTLLSIITGIFTGYKYGYELKTRFRFLSAIIFIVLGIKII